MSSATEGPVAKGEPRAWVKMPSESEIATQMENHPYAIGFVPAMGRLLRSHPRIGSAFAQLSWEIMFSPQGSLTRPERELVALAAATAQDCFY